jgi:hypothetical protein
VSSNGDSIAVSSNDDKRNCRRLATPRNVVVQLQLAIPPGVSAPEPESAFIVEKWEKAKACERRFEPRFASCATFFPDPDRLVTALLQGLLQSAVLGSFDGEVGYLLLEAHSPPTGASIVWADSTYSGPDASGVGAGPAVNTDLIDDETLDALPDDPELAFAIFERAWRTSLMKAIEGEDDGNVINNVRFDFMHDVIAAARHYDIPDLKDFKLPSSRSFDWDAWEDFNRKVQYFTMHHRLSASAQRSRSSVELQPTTRRENSSTTAATSSQPAATHLRFTEGASKARSSTFGEITLVSATNRARASSTVLEIFPTFMWSAFDSTCVVWYCSRWLVQIAEMVVIGPAKYASNDKNPLEDTRKSKIPLIFLM